MTRLSDALGRLKAGQFDGDRCGVRYVRFEDGYLFRLVGDREVFASSIGVDLSPSATSNTVFDRNDHPHRAGFDSRQGSLEVVGDSIFLRWRSNPEVP